MISDGRFILKLERGKRNIDGFYIKSSPSLGSTKLLNIRKAVTISYKVPLQSSDRIL